ncbi:MAG: hypothetical protein KAJ10_02445 [Thermodesulfovibrionia bacterium]|nr:hypothetical protein [Thermodesulfovibrionia bacterium]
MEDIPLTPCQQEYAMQMGKDAGEMNKIAMDIIGRQDASIKKLILELHDAERKETMAGGCLNEIATFLEYCGCGCGKHNRKVTPPMFYTGWIVCVFDHRVHKDTVTLKHSVGHWESLALNTRASELENRLAVEHLQRLIKHVVNDYASRDAIVHTYSTSVWNQLHVAADQVKESNDERPTQ